MSDNSIGDFVFLELLGGGPELPKQIVDVIERDGVAGTAFKLENLKGRPFTLRSRVDAESITDGQTYFANYTNYIGSGSYPITWRDETVEAILYVVINVTIAALLSRNGDLTGGLNDPSEGWVEADWTLVPIVGGEEARPPKSAALAAALEQARKSPIVRRALDRPRVVSTLEHPIPGTRQWIEARKLRTANP